MAEQKISVLYVDDETSLLDLGKLFLERLGNISVDTSPSAQKALEMIASGDYDGIVSDYQMPGMDGIEFLQVVRKEFGDIPFILFTGRGREEVVIQAINFGADFYLQKGGEPKSQFAELEHKIRQAVRRKDAERSLRESEKRLSDIIEFLPDPTFAIDVSGTVIAWNRAASDLTGVAPEEIIGKGRGEYAHAFYHSQRPTLIDLIDEPDEKILDYYSNIQRDGSSLTAETDLYHADGSLLHIVVKVSRLFDEKGTITGAIESIRDITNQKNAELEIRRSEERYRSVVNDQTEMIARFTKDGVISFTNEAYRQYYAHSIDLGNPVGKNIRDIMEIKNYTVVEDFLNSLTPDSPTREMEREVTGRDGKKYGQIWTVRALFDEDGKKSEYQVVGRDITDRKQAEERLKAAYEQIAGDEEELREKYRELKKSEQLVRESEARLVLAQEIAHTGAWEYNLRTDTIWGSAEGLAIFGFPPVAGDFPIEQIELCIPERERVHQALIDLIKDGIPYDLEYAITPFDGSEKKYIHSRARCERDEEGNIVRIMGIIQDITERKLVEAELSFKNVILQTQQEAAPEGILIVDMDGVILGYNKKFIEIWGIPEHIISTLDDDLTLQYVRNSVVDPESFFNRVKYLYDHPDERSFEEVALQNGKILERFSAPMIGDGGDYYGRVWFFRDVTDRKRAEEKLQAAYDQITGIAETIPGVVFQFFARDTGDTGLSYVSSRVDEILGMDGDLSKFLPRFTEGVVPEDKARFLASIDTAITTESKWEFEGWFKRSDEVLIFLKGMAAPVRVKDGLLFSGVILDVTAEQEMKDFLESEKMFSKLLLDTSPAFVVAIGFDGKTLMMNQLLLDTLGYTADEVIGKDYLDTFVPERDRAELAGVFGSIIQKNIITSNENRIISKSGVEYLVEWHGRPVPGSSGIRDFFVGVGIDVTHRREEEERLRRGEERYRSLIETTGTGYVALDEEGKVLDANDEYVRLTGRSSIEEILGRPVTDWTAPDDLARNAEEVRRCFESGSVRGLRIDYIHPDGSLCPVEINASVFRSKDDTVILTLCRGILPKEADS